MTSQYSASVPSDGTVKPEIQRFFEKFYQVSDTPSGHDTYADMFTPDGTLIMASNKVQGREAIIKLRHGMWEKVAKRSHRPAQLYAFGAGSHDVMLFGTVDYTLKDGRGTTVDWSARARFSSSSSTSAASGGGDDGELKMKFYQVYLDTAAMANAK